MTDQQRAATAQPKLVYRFSAGHGEGDKSMKRLLGGKGANLDEMSAIGLPVPPGYTIPTEACHFYTDHDGAWHDVLDEAVRGSTHHIETLIGKRFGDSDNPLLVSVRSGAAVSIGPMPSPRRPISSPSARTTSRR